MTGSVVCLEDAHPWGLCLVLSPLLSPALHSMAPLLQTLPTKMDGSSEAVSENKHLLLQVVSARRLSQQGGKSLPRCARSLEL